MAGINGARSPSYKDTTSTRTGSTTSNPTKEPQELSTAADKQMPSKPSRKRKATETLVALVKRNKIVESTASGASTKPTEPTQPTKQTETKPFVSVESATTGTEPYLCVFWSKKMTPTLIL